MISQFIAGPDESINYSLTEAEIEKLKVYQFECDIQIDIIDEQSEENPRTPINHIFKKKRNVTVRKRETGRVTKAGHCFILKLL